MNQNLPFNEPRVQRSDPPLPRLPDPRRATSEDLALASDICAVLRFDIDVNKLGLDVCGLDPHMISEVSGGKYSETTLRASQRSARRDLARVRAWQRAVARAGLERRAARSTTRRLGRRASPRAPRAARVAVARVERDDGSGGDDDPEPPLAIGGRR